MMCGQLLFYAAVAERGTAEARVRLSGRERYREMVCVDAAQGETRIIGKGWVFSILLLVFPFQSHFFFLGSSIKKQKHEDINLPTKIQRCV